MKSGNVPVILFILVSIGCSCKKGNTHPANHKPSAGLSADLLQVNPFTFKFKVIASDVDGDPLTYIWDFGEGTTRQGNAEETFSYANDKSYAIKVKVSDGKSDAVEANVSVSTDVVTATLDNTKQYQVMEGFGGFGAQDVYWSSGPFTSTAFVNTLMNDLGVTILRDVLPSNFEVTNDNNDPDNIDLNKFNINNPTPGHDGKLADHLQYLKDMKAAGLNKLIVSVWTPQPWMKYNDKLGNGTTNQTSAPAYNTSPDANTNQLKPNMYQEFAESCVAYIKVIKQETGIDLYALSIQNEPRFSQYYSSCVYNGEALRDLLKIVGKRFKDEGISTRLFLPEDVGWLEGVQGMIKPTLDDPDARQYADIVAVHGYALNGVTAASPDAQAWKTMYSWGAQYGKPLWMTETSGFSNDYSGAVALAKAMYTAINFGNVSAWLFWSLSTSNLDGYCLMSSSGTKSKRYYVSKNFYRFIRPGAQRFDVIAPENSHVLPLAFRHTADNKTTIVIINDNKTDAKAVKLTGTGIPSQFNVFVTSETDDCADKGVINGTDVILVPANAVVTLYQKN